MQELGCRQSCLVIRAGNIIQVSWYQGGFQKQNLSYRPSQGSQEIELPVPRREIQRQSPNHRPSQSSRVVYWVTRYKDDFQNTRVQEHTWVGSGTRKPGSTGSEAYQSSRPSGRIISWPIAAATDGTLHSSQSEGPYSGQLDHMLRLGLPVRAPGRCGQVSNSPRLGCLVGPLTIWVKEFQLNFDTVNLWFPCIVNFSKFCRCSSYAQCHFFLEVSIE